MKNGKAGGESGILPEMLKAICDEKEILEMLLSLIHQMWEDSTFSHFLHLITNAFAL